MQQPHSICSVSFLPRTFTACHFSRHPELNIFVFTGVQEGVLQVTATPETVLTARCQERAAPVLPWSKLMPKRGSRKNTESPLALTFTARYVVSHSPSYMYSFSLFQMYIALRTARRALTCLLCSWCVEASFQRLVCLLMHNSLVVNAVYSNSSIHALDNDDAAASARHPRLLNV